MSGENSKDEQSAKSGDVGGSATPATSQDEPKSGDAGGSASLVDGKDEQQAKGGDPGGGASLADSKDGGLSFFGYPKRGGGVAPPKVSTPLSEESTMAAETMRQELKVLLTREDTKGFKNAVRLLEKESTALEENIDPEWLEAETRRPITVVKRVLVPKERFPHFNFIGKLVGPKGAHIKALVQKYRLQVYVQGGGSMRDPAKEAQLLASGDARHAHLASPLHIKIQATGTPSAVYGRLAGVLADLSMILQPVYDYHPLAAMLPPPRLYNTAAAHSSVYQRFAEQGLQPTAHKSDDGLARKRPRCDFTPLPTTTTPVGGTPGYGGGERNLASVGGSRGAGYSSSYGQQNTYQQRSGPYDYDTRAGAGGYNAHFGQSPFSHSYGSFGGSGGIFGA